MVWKKIVLVLFNVVLAAYLLLAMTAFNRPDTETVCRSMDISIEEDVLPGFLTSDEVRRMLITDQMSPIGKTMSAINLREMEESLEAKELIEEAECWTTQDGTVSISIRQRIPVIRVMNNQGEDYYVDSNGRPMPHTEYACRLIVCTGYVSKQYAAKVLAPLANIINGDTFWKNATVQLNILADGSVEMVPRVGKHIVYLGQPQNVKNKLERLRKFYRHGLNKVGWNKYSRINVEYGNQIICKRK